MSTQQPGTINTATHTNSADVDIPAVVAVVVAKDPGVWFEDMLYSLAEQDYENLSVLVVDAGSENPVAERIAVALPEAYIHRIAGDPGWSVAANQALELVSGSPFLMFCHDDVVLERSCVSTMMAELYKSNAAVVGPKMVEWDDPRRILQVGVSSDRFGVVVEQVDRGEFDQQQYDSPRDIFCVPGGVQLVRADLLSAIGGFDEGISFIGEDLDLCWRAHAVGARVRIVPKAKAKHIESADQKVTSGFRRRLQTRHRLRSVIANTSGLSRFSTIPMAVVLIVLEGLYALFNGRRKHAREVLSAIPWNIARWGSARQRSKQLKRIRKLSDAEVRRKQLGGSAQLSQFWREKFEAGQSRVDSVLTSASSRTDSASAFHSLIVFGVVMVILILASRSILTSSYNVFGQIPAMGNSLGLIREWLGGWRSAGTGGEANAPLAYLFLGTLRSFFFFAPGLFDRLLLFGPLLIGYWGSSRIARPYGSPRIGSIVGALYVLNPVVFSIMRAGRWDSLIIWCSLPFMLTSLLKLMNVEPFAERQDAEDNFFAPRTLPVRIVRFGFLVTAVATFAPSAVVVAVFMALALMAVSVSNVRAFRGLFGAAVSAVIVPAVLLLPWSFDVISNFSWSWLTGSKSSEAAELSALDILVFRSTDFAAAGDVFALNVSTQTLAVAGAVLPVFAFASALLSKAKPSHAMFSGFALFVLTSLGLWIESQDLLPYDLPATESLMAMSAVGLLLVIASAAGDFELSFGRSVSRTRYIVPAITAVGLLLVFSGGVTMASSGRWAMPETPRRSTAEALFASRIVDESEVETTGRILWLGEPSVIPVDTYPTPGGIEFAISNAQVDVRNKWVPGPVGGGSGVARHLDLAYEGGTSSLGSLIASYGIDYVVVSEQIARNYKTNPVDRRLEAALERQLDLQLDKSGNDDFTIYRNIASGGVASALANFTDAESTTALDQLEVDLASNPVASREVSGRPGRWQIEVPEDQAVYVALSENNFSVGGVRSEASVGFDGMMVLEPGPEGTVELDYGFSFLRTLSLLAQFLLISTAIVVAQTRKGAER